MMFEDLEAWQQARQLVNNIYSLTRENSNLAKDFGLTGQVQRAAVSIMSNIAEGFERGSDREFRQFLYVAKASAGEVRSLLYIALDLGCLDAQAHQLLMEQATRLSRQLSGFIKYLSSDLR